MGIGVTFWLIAFSTQHESFCQHALLLEEIRGEGYFSCMSGRKAQDGEQLHAAREPLALLSLNLPKTNLHVNLVFHGPFLHREAGERSNPPAPSSFFLSSREVSSHTLPWAGLHSQASFSFEKGYISILFGHSIPLMGGGLSDESV